MGSHLTSGLAVVLFAFPVLGGEPGVVKGTYTLNGKSYTPDHVYAISVPSLKDETKQDVRVIFSVGPQEAGKLLSEGKGQELSLSVTIGPGWPDVDPSIGFRYAHGSDPTSKEMIDLGAPRYSESSFSGLADVTFEKKAFDSNVGKKVSGKLHIPLGKGEVSLGADLEFDVPVLGMTPKVK